VKEYDYEPPIAPRMPGSSRAEQQAASDAARKNTNRGSTSPSAGASASSDEASSEARRLAEQSQRDVELLMRNRPAPSAGDASSPGAASTPRANASNLQSAAAAPPPAARAAPPTPKPIEWNERPKIAAAAAPPSDGKSAPSPSELLAMSRDPAGFLAMPPSSAAGSLVAASQPAASQPDASALRPDRIRQLTVDLARELYAAGAYSENPLRELVVIAAMNMSDPERKLDPAAIPDLTDDERQVLASLQTFFANMGESMDKGSEMTAEVASAAASLRSALVHEPQLKLPSIALCTRVGGFGDYSPFERNAFLAGAEQKAIVYLEIADFVSEVNQNNEYVTELSQQLTLYSDRDGIPVWKEDWQPATDVTRNKRQDFFTVQVIKFPKALSVGRYTLKVRVRDEKSKAESESSLPVEIVADPKMAN
jgi:hypothetical protein